MYSSLSKIPVKIFYIILETLDYNLLLEESDKHSFISNETLLNLWLELKKEYDSKYINNESSLYEVKKEIEILTAKHTQIILICHCLKFEWDQELVDILIENLYEIKDDENYIEYINTIERQSEALLIKINRLKDLLPKKTEENIEEKTNLDDIMASYSSILRIDFDYETISVTKFYSLQKQVDLKIQNLKKQSSKKI
jgi:hypothetical protein